MYRSQLEKTLWGIARHIGAFAAAVAITVAAVPTSSADDLTALAREVASSTDFRLRVGGALSLGRSKSRAAVRPLTGALDDPHPAVRAAAAAALAVLGDREALRALRGHASSESSEQVRSQIRVAIEKLQAIGAPVEGSARVLVKLGQLKNLTGVRGTQLVDVFRGATRAKAAELPGVEVLADASEGPREAEVRRLPLLVLDGVVNQLAKGATGEQVTVSARVEFVFRKVPEHALTGSVTGAARANDSAKILRDEVLLAQLENQALRGAVESAMRGAPVVMQQALR